MTKIQKVYRELRRYVSRAEARYAAPKLVEMFSTEIAANQFLNEALGL